MRWSAVHQLNLVSVACLVLEWPKRRARPVHPQRQPPPSERQSTRKRAHTAQWREPAERSRLACLSPFASALTWLGPRDERRTQELRVWVEQRHRHRHRHRKMMESSIKYKWSNSHDGKRRPRTSSETAASRLRSLYTQPLRPSFLVQRNCSGRVEGGADIAPLQTREGFGKRQEGKKVSIARLHS